MALLYEILVEQFPGRPYVRRERLPVSWQNYYVFEDGRRLSLGYAPAWCPRCRAFVRAEDVETLARVDEQIRDYERWDPMPERDEALAALALRRQWVIGRRSPARCLHCFAAEAVVFPHRRRVRHPDDGAAWVMAMVVGLALPKQAGEWILTPEGLPWMGASR